MEEKAGEGHLKNKVIRYLETWRYAAPIIISINAMIQILRIVILKR